MIILLAQMRGYHTWDRIGLN
ncbi:MAG: hypothetical protein RLZZ613_9, partial [Pseudomonadota bacterium]